MFTFGSHAINTIVIIVDEPGSLCDRSRRDLKKEKGSFFKSCHYAVLVIIF